MNKKIETNQHKLKNLTADTLAKILIQQVIYKNNQIKNLNKNKDGKSNR